MKEFSRYINFTVLIAIIILSSCVPQRKFQDKKAERDQYKQQKEDCEETLSSLQKEHNQLQKKNQRLEEKVSYLQEDTAMLGRKYRKTQAMNDNLNDLYEEVIAQNKKLLETSSSERAKLNMELSKKERKLSKKEEELDKLADSLRHEQQQIGQLRSNLQEREQKVNELERVLAKKDSVNTALKKRISQALLSFDDSELSVEIKDGKIYVSLAEKLLFGSGSTQIDQKGKDALEKLANVLKKQAKTDVLVEGHTDSIPITTNCIEDNWDLSVLRATSIVRIMIDNGLNPERLIPSGRSKYVPVATNDTKEGRRKNRRTEIILAPKLDQIYNVIQQP